MKLNFGGLSVKQNGGSANYFGGQLEVL